jgi:gliding motility-associated-like protein
MTKVSLAILLLCSAFTASASHNVGTEITYECIDPATNTYEITFVYYRDCDGASAPTSANITFASDSGCTFPAQNLPRVSVTDVSQLCDPNASTCSGGTEQGTEMHIYQGTITGFPDTCGTWQMIYTTCCRSAAITNLQNPSSQGTFTRATYNNQVAPCNNSVQFTNSPILYVCDSTDVQYNHGAFDPDGDTLRFTLVTPQDDNFGTPSFGTNIPYAGTFTNTQPMQTEVPNTFAFNPTTGEMRFMPAAGVTQVVIIAVLVEEIRNGVVIGSSIRELQVVVLTNCNNTPPVTDSTSITGSAVNINITQQTLEMCQGNIGTFQLVIQDFDGDTLSVTSNIQLAIAGGIASYSVDSTVVDSVILTVTVDATNLTPGTYPFSININDNACPVPSVQLAGYALVVYGASYSRNIYCRNESDPVPIIIGDSSGVFLELPGNPAGLVFDSITGIIDLSASNVGSYNLIFVPDTNSICPTDSMQITIIDIPNPSFGYPDTIYCRQGVNPTPIITGNPGGSFSATAGIMVNQFTGEIDLLASSPVSGFVYYDVVGGTCAARDSFAVDITSLDIFEATSNQYFMCPNELDTIQLGVNISYSGTLPTGVTYNWTPTTNISATNIPNPEVILLTAETYILNYNDNVCPPIADTVDITTPYPAVINPTSNIVLCNGNAAQIGASVNPGPGDQTFTYAGNRTITGPTTGTDTTIFTLNVAGVAPNLVNPALLASMEMCFGINLSLISYAQVYLIAPSGEEVVISDRNGGAFGTSLTGGTFSNNPANTPVTTYSGPFPTIPNNTAFLPQNGITGFNPLIGATTNGVWQLKIVHNNPSGLGGPNGTLTDWCLNFQDLSAATFSWAPNTNISCVACDSPTVNPTANTTYTVIAQNTFGCRDTAAVNVVIDSALPTPILTCGNATSNSVTFNWVPVFGAAGYVAVVDGGAPQILPATADSLQVTGLTSGACSEIIIFAQSGNSCQDGAPDTLICCAQSCGPVGPATITPNGSTTFCLGQNVVLDAGGGSTTYTWNTPVATPATTQTVTVNASGTYMVTTTDAQGCLDTASIVVTVVPGPVVNITLSGSDTLCAGETVDLDAGAGFNTYTWNNGAGATQIVTVNTSGNYIVTVTDAVGCVGIDSVQIVVGTPVTAPVVGQDLSCNSVTPADGQATASPTGGFGGYTYNWNPTGQNTATATGLAVGAYSVTVTDIYNCTATSSVTISEPSALSVTMSNTNVTCFNGSDATATVVAAGGAGGYNYNWNPSGQTTATATGLSAGPHNVTVTDVTGCTITGNVVVTQPAVTVTSTATVTSIYPNGAPISCNGVCNGEATAAGNGGTPAVSGYVYQWDASAGSQATAIATGLCANVNYSVTVTDSLGCTSVSIVSMTEPSAITITVDNQNDPTCNGATNGDASITATGGAGAPYTYAWSTSPGQTTNNVTGLSVVAGPNYTVTVTDANGCTNTETITVTEPSAVSVTASVVSDYNGADISCNGNCDGELLVVGTGGTGTFTYQWDAAAASQTTDTARAICAGTYRVTVTDVNGCSDSTTVTITEPTLLTSTTTSTDATCNGVANGTGTVTPVGGTGAYSYNWSTVPAQTTALATGLEATTGQYIVTVSDANSCVVFDTVNIAEPTAVTATIATVPANCNGAADGTATATAAGGTPGAINPYTYDWGTGFGPSATSPGTAAGIYTVTIADGNNCTITESYTITEPAAISFTVANTDASCNGTSDGTATINVSGGVGGFTYLWNLSPAQTTATATGLPAGLHCVTVTDLNGCFVDTCIQVNEPAGMTNITFAAQPVSCNGGSDGQLTVSLSGGIQPYTYLWSNGQTGNTSTGLAATTHTVTITDANGCTISDNSIITEPTPVQVALTVDSVQCKNGSDGQITAMGSGGTPPYTYQWSDGQNSVIATGLTAGTYSVTTTDFNGCTVSASATVAEPLSPLVGSIINQQDPTCNGDTDGSIEVDAQGATPNYTYVWNNGQTTSTATGIGAGQYRVTVTDANGCTLSVSGLINEPTAIVLSTQVLSNYNGAAISCPGQTDGSVGVIAAGGSGTYSYQWSPTGLNTATIANLGQGTYDVTVTDIAGCSADTSITINDPIQLAATFSQVDILCNGDQNGQILANATPGTGTLGINGYEYNLAGPGQTGNVYSSINSWTNLAAGAYVVSVRDGNNCEVQLNVNITEPDLLVVDSVIVTDVLCNGDATGTATAYGSGGTMPYSYVWSHDASQTGQVASGLALGVYSVTIVDANGCDRVDVFNVNEPTPLVGSATNGTIACIGGVANATATATGGTPIGLVGYLYNWDDGNTNATAINLSAGIHCVTITDDNACTDVVCVTITEPSSAVSATIANSTDANCNGTADGTATGQGVGGTAPYTYEWNTLPIQTTATATGLAAGTYQVTVRDTNGCMAMTTVVIGEPTGVTALLTTTNPTTCFNGNDGSAGVVAQGGTAPYSYLWSSGETTATAVNLTAGADIVTVTDVNGCNTTVSYTIGAPTAISITQFNSTDVNCKGGNDGTASILPTGGTPTTGYTYQWSGSASTGPNVNDLSAGIQYVTISDANGCQLVDTFTIDEPLIGLSGYVTMTPALCNGQNSGILTATISGGTGFYTYNWSSGATTMVSDSLVAGTYTVTVTDGNGCNLTFTEVVTEASPIQVTASVLNNVACDGALTGQAQATNATGGTAPYSYVWSDGTGQTGLVATGLGAGVITVIATDANTCTATASVTITEPVATTLTENIVDVSCNGLSDGSITITGANKTIVSYVWSNSVVGNTNSNLAAGTYTVTVTDSDLCTAVFAYTVEESDAMQIELMESNSIACYGDTTAQLEATVSGGRPAYSYAWNNGATTMVNSNLGAGTYTVTVTDNRGCMVDATLLIEEPSELIVTGLGTQVLCTGDANGTITVNGQGGTVNIGNLEYSIDGGSNWQTGNIFTSLTAGDYRIQVRDENGCISDTLIPVIPADTFYIVDITADTNIVYLDSMELLVELNDTSSIMYSWSSLSNGGTLLTDSSYSYFVAPIDGEQYEFVATNRFGCEVSHVVNVEVDKPRPANAPNGFTPNGDGVNDRFFVQGGDKVEEVMVLRVFDRWGELVYDGSSMTVNDETTGWDGTFRGQDSPAGSYVWYSEVKFKDGHIEVIKGDVTLLR